ncbi:MAG: tail fiber protein [Bryobacteraceae bacterium]
MADLPQQNTIVQYVADGITTNYIVPFYTPIEINGTPDLDVYTQAANATPVPATDINEWNVAYTYTPNLDPITGGIITFQLGFIPPAGYIVTIVRDVSASLDTEFSQAQNFSGYTLDLALDKLLLIAQQNKSYTLERNLSYIINTYLPESTISANVQIPVLGAGQIWFGSAGGVIAVTLEQSSDTSTLRSELANEQPVTNGAAIVGYYDPVNLAPTTVADQLTYLTNSVVIPIPAGTILDFAGSAAPAEFLLCDGTQYLIANQPALFTAIGNRWGGDGITTFNVPDLRGLVTAGAGGTLPPLANTVGSTGGTALLALTKANMPVGVPANASNSGNTGITANSGLTTVPAGGPNSYGQGAGANITLVQPTAIVLKIIKT